MVGQVTTKPTANSTGIMTYSCSAGCGYSRTETITEVPYYDKITDHDGYVTHSFDALNFCGNPYKSGTADISAVTQLVISGGVGETVGLAGWVGYDCAIIGFGYYVGDDYYDTITLSEFMLETGTEVTNIGGQYAKRFSITAVTEGLTTMGTTKLTFVALLSDGSLVELYSVDLYNPGEQITTATPDPMPEYTTGASNNSGNATYPYVTTTGDYFNANGNYNAETGGFLYSTADTFVINPDTSITSELHNKIKIS